MTRRKPDSIAVFPTTEKEKQRVALIRETGNILEKVYKNLWALHEVNAAIKTGYYVDERVLLKDLLTPDKSPLYKTGKFIAANARKGSFKKTFAEQLLKGNYPLLKAIIGQPPSAMSRASDDGWPSIESTNEIWTNENGLSIYFPYSEDFLLVNPFDVNINTVNGQLVTIVSADREADSAPGNEPYYCSTDPNQPMALDNLSVCFQQVTVDDDYAELHPVHIAGVGAEPNITHGPSNTNQVYVVFIGEVMFTQHYDRLISFSGNGGGPELRFIRGDGFLQQGTNGQITNATNVISVDLKRKYKGMWRPVYSVWDANWEVGNSQQVFGIYEEDTQGSQTFSGSVQTTLTFNGGSTQIGPIGYSITVQTQDNIIKQLEWDRTSFFQYNQGGLNNGCGTKNGWTIYDCFGGVLYTMPTQ